MQKLDDVASKYFQGPDLEIENNLIMSWYPRRIALRTGPVKRCLELGLGHGYTVRSFQDLAEEHAVVEGSRLVIEHFLGSNPWFSGEIIEGYFETYEPEGRFDLIVMGFVLEHVENPVAIMNRYRQFLAPAGRLFVAVPNAKSLNRRLGLEMGMISDIYALNATDHKLGHKRNYCRETLAADSHAAGFQIVHQEGIYLKPLPLGILRNLDDMEANLNAMLNVGVDYPDLCVALLFELSQQNHE